MKTKQYITGFLYKAFVPFGRNSTIPPEGYLYPLIEAARSHCYVENVHTAGNKADSLHRRIELTYEEDVTSAYSRLLRPLIKGQHIGVAMLAIDITDEDFYGMFTDMYLHPWTGEGGVQARYQFAVLSLVGKHKVPLLAVPVCRGVAKEDVLKTFLQISHRLFRYIRCILLDAGFYSGAVIEALRHEKYIIRAPQQEPIKRYIAATKPRSSRRWKHTITWNADKTVHRTTTTIAIIRDVRWKSTEIDCSYATNMHLRGEEYVHLYSKRWQIETNFRMQDQVRIKSRSVRHIVRYFYFMISLLLHAIWLLFYQSVMAFDQFKIRLANTMFLQALELPYVDALV